MDLVKQKSSGHHVASVSRTHSLDANIDRAELRERYKAYLVGHYLSLHITVVSVVLAAAGVAAASLVTRTVPTGSQRFVLWLLWTGSLIATGVAYGGPMVGAFALPSSIPSVSDLLLPLLVGVVEFLFFTILVPQVTSAGLDSLVSTWLVAAACFCLLASLSVLRARYHYSSARREGVYSSDVDKMMQQYLQYLTRDYFAAIFTMTLAAAGAALRMSETVRVPDFIFPLGITTLFLMGLYGHSRTAQMWRQLLPHKLGDRASADNCPSADHSNDV